MDIIIFPETLLIKISSPLEAYICVSENSKDLYSIEFTPIDSVNILFKDQPDGAISPSGTVLVCPSSNIILEATANANFTYQWYLNGNEIDYDFVENHIGDRFSPTYFEGMTVKSLEKNIPGNAIIKDSSIIHGPSNYHLKGSGKKLNISIRLFKEVEDWNPDTTFSVRSFEESRNKRTYYNDKWINAQIRD